ncbi:MAG TPA: ATP-binding protein [Anaerolineae bacterium]|nr:ATP-binding protein [Anaerolineae bacterium]
MDTIGYVVGEVRTDEFTFVTNREIAPPRLEYIVVEVEEDPERKARVQVLAQVTKLSVSSRLLDTSLSYNEVAQILTRISTSQPIIVGTAQVLGYLDSSTVRYPRHATMPGNPVTKAPDDLLKRFFSQDVDSGIDIGALINRDNVSVLLNPNGLRRHLAVIAQTGAGKSYTVGVILEKLLELGGTIVIFDPNSDYVKMRRDETMHVTPFADRVEIYRMPTGQAGRISDQEIGGSKKFTMKFSALEVEEICAMTGIPETSTNIRKALQTAHDNLRGRDYAPHEFLRELEHIANGGSNGTQSNDTMPRGPERSRDKDAPLPGMDDFRRAAYAKANLDVDWEDFGSASENAEEESPRVTRSPASDGANGSNGKTFSLDAIAGASKALKYVERLTRVNIWGHEEVPLNDILRPMSLSVIDLAGVDSWIAEFVVDKVLRDTWGEATTNGLPRPVFFVLEEAHNFVPGGQGARSQAAQVIKRIASEGRKFGLFLVLVTQRPYKIHGDTLSQCNSQIIMRLTNPQDQLAIKQSSEGISEGLLGDLPGLNVGEAVILGPIVRVPVMVRIGHRLSAQGGNDIDVVKALADARSQAVIDKREREFKTERTKQKKTEWAEELDA